MSTEPEVTSWLESLTRHLAGLEEYRRRVESRLAPEFNMLRYARTDECGLSVILADLLDPSGPHGQGDRFLVNFLKLHWKEREKFSGPVSVKTEAATDRIQQSQGRIDILVDLGDAILAIENKPWASDQPDQLKRYLDHLQRSGKLVRIIYLTGADDRQPSEFSMDEAGFKAASESGVLASTSYHQLGDWLRDCQRDCDNERVWMFLREFERWVAKTFAGDQSDFGTEFICETALRSSADIAAAFRCAALATDVRFALLQKLELQLRQQFELRTDGWRLRIAHRLDKLDVSGVQDIDAGIDIYRHDRAALRIRFAFDSKRCDDLYYGVCGYHKNDNTGYPQLRESLDQKIGGRHEKSYPYWVWLRSFPKGRWWVDPEAWRWIVSGQMAEEIVARANEAIAVVDANGLLPLFEQQATTFVEKAVDLNTRHYERDAIADIIANASAMELKTLFKVEAARYSMIVLLAKCVADAVLRVVGTEPALAHWKLECDADLTARYHGMVMRSDLFPGILLCFEFQKYNCRGAIYGICLKGLDGRGPEAEILRRRLSRLGGGRSSPGWVWYKDFIPGDWFDTPQTAVDAYNGTVAENLVDTFRRLAVALESSVGDSAPGL